MNGSVNRGKRGGGQDGGAGSVALVPLALLLGLSGALVAAPESAPPLERCMPDDVVAFVKVEPPAAEIRDLLASGLWKRIESSAVYQFASTQEKSLELNRRLEEIESATGKKPLAILDDLAGDGAMVGVRLTFPPEVLVMTRARGEARLQSGVRALKDIVRAAHGTFPETQKTDREGVTIETAGPISFAVAGRTFMISNSSTAVQAMVDLVLGKSGASVAQMKTFAPLFASKTDDRRPGSRKLAVAGLLPGFLPNFLDRIPAKVDNFPGSMLISGWLEALRKSEMISASLEVARGDLRLSLSSRARPGEDLEGANGVFFPSDDSALDYQEVGRLRRHGLVGIVHIRRDLARWWESRETYLNAKGLGDLVNFSNVMNVIFGGRSFQDEVLPALESGLTLLARRVSYEELGAAPSPQIPGFAAILRLRDAERFSRSMQAAFQSLVGIANADRAQKGKPLSFLVQTEDIHGVKVHTASAGKPEDASAPPGIEYNFSPSLAVVGSRVVISSNRDLAEIVVRELSRKPPSTTIPAVDSRRRPNDLIQLDAAEIDRLVEANADVIAAKAMLDDGIGPDEAEGRVRAIRELLGLVDSLDVRTRHRGRTAAITLSLRPSRTDGGRGTTKSGDEPGSPDERRARL